MKASDFTEDAFEAWRELPITRLFMDALEAQCGAAKEQWVNAAWNAERANPAEREAMIIELNRTKVRIDAYRAMAESTLANLLAANGLQQPTEEGQQ